MKGKRIGVLAGGTSAERDVSLRTGSAIHQALLDLGHDSVFIDASSQVCETLRKEAVHVAFIAYRVPNTAKPPSQGLWHQPQ